jgi:DNA-binding MarR family transcriptional regulator
MAAKGPDERPPVTPQDLDPVIHERVRLSIASVLAARHKVDYLELRALLGLTDGNLAGHLRVLERAGYVEFEKSFVDRKTRTTYRLTPAGRRAFQQHVEVLASLLPRPQRRKP